jgi:hypothetical protein
VSGNTYVVSLASSSGRPSVALLALGGAATTALDDAVAAVRKLPLDIMNVVLNVVPRQPVLVFTSWFVPSRFLF